MSDRKFNILHLIETTGPGGAETVLLNLVSRIDRAIFEPTVLLVGEGWLSSAVRAAGIEPLTIGSSGSFDWRFLKSIIKVIRERNIDLIHSHLPDISVYACLAALRTKTPVISTFHGMVGNWHQRSLKNRLKMSVIRRRAARVVAVSDFLKQEMSDLWSFCASDILRIYNGVDFDSFDQRSGGSELRRQFTLPSETVLIGTVGNIRRAKGYQFMLQAAREVIDRNNCAHFFIAGHGEGELLEEILQLQVRLGLQEHVHLLGFRDDVPQLLGEFDIFVLPSITEGLSIATVEAMGLGLPVVVTDSGGPREIVEHMSTGMLVAPGDPAALAAAIGRLLEDAALAQNLGAAARVAVREKFGIEQNIAAYTEVYKSCLR